MDRATGSIRSTLSCTGEAGCRPAARPPCTTTTIPTVLPKPPMACSNLSRLIRRCPLAPWRSAGEERLQDGAEDLRGHPVKTIIRDLDHQLLPPVQTRHRTETTSLDVGDQAIIISVPGRSAKDDEWSCTSTH